ncbi:MAG: PorV/PorQ family protein [Elusimicrobia bacterium]|nr:PorV/PorQ family protein [Candidatus Obscuribacterium magneticum]
MRKNLTLTLIFLWGSLGPVAAVQAEGRTEAGLTLLGASGARPAALGEAFTSAADDITALYYNPASLKTLRSGQASFLYQKGLVNDTYGQLVVGFPREKRAYGVSLGYYDGGSVSVFDGVTQRTVKSQTDYVLGVGAARTWKTLDVGGTFKYFSSELAETAKASAVAIDAGATLPVHPRVRLGASLQNFGTPLKYVSYSDDLPRIIRVGLSWLMIPGPAATTLFFDAPYHVNQSELRPAIGVESLVGPMALRAGYKTGGDLQSFSIGAGFMWQNASFDYAFGLVDKLESSHRISVSMRFAAAKPHQYEVKRELPAPVPVVSIQENPLVEETPLNGESPVIEEKPVIQELPVLESNPAAEGNTGDSRAQ